MQLKAEKTSNDYPVCPELDSFELAQVVDCKDYIRTNKDGSTEPALRFTLEIDRQIPESKRRYTVMTSLLNCTPSKLFSERSALRQFIETVRGEPIRDEELTEGTLDTEDLIGVYVYIQVSHSKPDDNGRVWANIDKMKTVTEDSPSTWESKWTRYEDRQSTSKKK